MINFIFFILILVSLILLIVFFYGFIVENRITIKEVYHSIKFLFLNIFNKIYSDKYKLKKMRSALRNIHDWNYEGLIKNKILRYENDFIVGNYKLRVPTGSRKYYQIIFDYKFLKNDYGYKEFLFLVTDEEVQILELNDYTYVMDFYKTLKLYLDE